jgi:hypothetical protein
VRRGAALAARRDRHRVADRHDERCSRASAEPVPSRASAAPVPGQCRASAEPGQCRAGPVLKESCAWLRRGGCGRQSGAG